jgi:2-methylcitrate dehydratase PrpD
MPSSPLPKNSSAILADYACGLALDDVPSTAKVAARNCLVDAVACAIFGSRFSWSKAAVTGSSLPAGPSNVPGLSLNTSPDKAALLSGVFAHAFELDSLRKPGSGVHPGATVALPALAMAQATGASGRDLIAAIVAGCEVMFRIGAATLHTAEKRGFHAPGITGVFGSAVAAGKILGLSERQIRHALGLSGSMSGGILAFAGSGTGGMVKRLHLGRAAESGIVAAKLAEAGFEAPDDVLETHFGVLETFCLDTDAGLLTAGLGEHYEIEKTCLKRYACHVTAQAPVEFLADLRAQHGFEAEAVTSIALSVPEKVASHHAARHPTDVALAQYSVPFMLAFSLFNDLDDPFSITAESIADPRIHALAERIGLAADITRKGWSIGLDVSLVDGRVFSGEAKTFSGTPERPLGDEALKRRFMTLTAERPASAMDVLFTALIDIESCGSVRRELTAAAAEDAALAHYL